MQKTSLATPLLALAALISSPLLADEAQPGADQVVGAIEGVFGVTPGERRNHIKGTCAAGEFVGTREAARLSKSPLFSGKPVPVVARFSVSGGKPKYKYVVLAVGK